MKAMILAAGRGVRMRPLTDETPKPLLPIAGLPLVAHHLLKLAAAGIRDVVVNVSYRAQQIMDSLGNGHDYGVNIEYSLEPTALETGGGIFQALPLLGRDPFLVLSADVYTHYPIAKLAQYALDNTPGIQAHLVLVDNPSFHPIGDFHLLPNNLLTLDGASKLTFASLAVIHPALFEGYKPGFFSLSTVLCEAIRTQGITGEYYRDAVWFNVGTIEELRRLESYLRQTQCNI